MTEHTIVERLARLDTPAVSDALDRLDLPGRVTHLRRLTTERRIAGRVLTVKLVQSLRILSLKHKLIF